MYSPKSADRFMRLKAVFINKLESFHSFASRLKGKALSLKQISNRVEIQIMAIFISVFKHVFPNDKIY